MHPKTRDDRRSRARVSKARAKAKIVRNGWHGWSAPDWLTPARIGKDAAQHSTCACVMCKDGNPTRREVRSAEDELFYSDLGYLRVTVEDAYELGLRGEPLPDEPMEMDCWHAYLLGAEHKSLADQDALEYMDEAQDYGQFDFQDSDWDDDAYWDSWYLVQDQESADEYAKEEQERSMWEAHDDAVLGIPLILTRY